jgi:hypothetical protein
MKKGPNPAYLALYIQANLAMANLLGLDAHELQRSVEEETYRVKDNEDIKSLSTEDLLTRHRKTIGIV